MTELPAGTVTFLFTDVEGSTKLLHELGSERYAEALAGHRRVLREAFARQGGVEVDTQGDAFFVAFPTAPGALAAAVDALGGLASGPIRVRMGVHTGTPYLAEEGYVGADVHRAARIAACGHGEQVLVSASTAALAGTEGLRDLGEHRLKDLSAPERIYQLGDGEFPPLKSLRLTNLPVPSTPFLGREQELQEVLGLLEGTRLLTLTGPGGTGKTRLGAQAAAEASDRYPDGVFWVPLAPLRDPELVLETAGQVLAAKDGLTGHIADKSLLLLFDNFEHVVEAADGLAELLAACPNVQLLVTSRELLRLPAEQAYPVPPLEPDDGTELFLARARAVEPGFVTTPAVAELCARLEQLPLALELAAARVRVLSPEQLLERLSGRLDLLKAGRGVDARQQTLRATIEWSYELLAEDEQRLFARLAVFRGGCTLDAAETVCDADLDTLQSLVDKSLLRHSVERFWMLETIREFGRDLLEEGGERDAVRRRHAEHYLGVAEAAYRGWLDADWTWSRRLDEEHDNLRAALDFLREDEPDECLQLAGALGWFWATRPPFAEASRRLEDALATSAESGRLRARALRCLAALDSYEGRTAEALSRLEQALELWRTVGDDVELMETRNELGMVLYRGGDTSQALHVFERNLELARSLGQQSLVTASLSGVCQLLLATGQFERAEPLAQELQDDHYLADCAMHRRDYALAERHYLRKLQSWLLAGEVLSQTFDALGLAMAIAGLGRDEDALRLEAAIDAKWDELGVAARPRVLETWRERDLGAARARLGEPRAIAAYEEGQAMTWDQAIGLALESAT